MLSKVSNSKSSVSFDWYDNSWKYQGGDVIDDDIDDAIDDVIDDVIDDSYLRDKCDPLSKKAGWWKFKLLQIDFDSICCWFFCIGCN